MSAPTTRFYYLRSGGQSFWRASSAARARVAAWARIWITDDGCFTTISDHGNYGYWWTAPGCEFRKFLCGCNTDYLANKLRHGETEFDGEESVKQIRRHICEWRRDGTLSRERAAEEWELVHPKPEGRWARGRHSSMVNEIEANRWYEETKLDDASELLCYRTPMQLQMFLKHLWPLFVEKLKLELALEAKQGGAR